MGCVIGFAGLSHLGLASSIAAASKGFQVVAYDDNPQLTAALSRKELHVHEPDLDDLLAGSAQRIEFTSDVAALRACDVVVISLDTPTSDENEADLSGIEELVLSVRHSVRAGATVVVLSQIRPGFMRGIASKVREAAGAQTPVYHQVETLIFGRAVERATRPERIIVGCETPHLPLPAAYQQFLEAFDCPLLPMRYESAELCKTAINLFLVASVSTTNTLAEICESIGADWSEIAPALRLDRRIGPYAYLAPGLGIAGGNLERDLTTLNALATAGGADAGVINAYIQDSRYRKRWVLRKLHQALAAPGMPSAPVIGVWGLAYKTDTHSTKNSPSLSLLDDLVDFQVQAYDPQATIDTASYPHVTICDTPLAACQGADMLAVMTPWPEFAALPPQDVATHLRGRRIIDPNGLLDAAEYSSCSITCTRLGNADPVQEAA